MRDQRRVEITFYKTQYSTAEPDFFNTIPDFPDIELVLYARIFERWQKGNNMRWGRHISHWMDKLDQELEPPKEFRLSRSRIMYIEAKAEGLEGPAVIGRVYFSKSGKTIYYKGLRFQSLKGAGFKANYFDIESGEHYWISGPRKDENNRLFGGNKDVLVDDDVSDEYETLLSS